jgi:hypothetical protein
MYNSVPGVQLQSDFDALFRREAAPGETRGERALSRSQAHAHRSGYIDVLADQRGVYEIDRLKEPCEFSYYEITLGSAGHAALGGSAGYSLDPDFRAPCSAESFLRKRPRGLLMPRSTAPAGSLHLSMQVLPSMSRTQCRPAGVTAESWGATRAFARIRAQVLSDDECEFAGVTQTRVGTKRYRACTGSLDGVYYPHALASDPGTGIALVELRCLRPGREGIGGPFELSLDARPTSSNFRAAAAGRGVFDDLRQAFVRRTGQ